jgi:asparagine synthase (glutamine-hydrolysing)
VKNTIGDILILFDSQSRPSVGRVQNAEWQVWNGVPSAWLQGSTADWKGFPFQSVERAGWHVLKLGELPVLETWLPRGDFSWKEFQQKISNQTGSFIIFAWHPSDQTWHIWTDRFGTLHAYHAWDGHRAALGTFSPSVATAASQRILDWEALVAWFSFGFFPADRTHFTDLHILRPASHYVFNQIGRLLQQERYWNWSYQPDEKRSYADTVAQFGSIFSDVMADALSAGCVAMPISGGLDSRSTVTAVTPELAQGGRLWPYSYGYSADSVETQIARQVAQARGLPLQSYAIQPYVFDQIERLLAYTEGFQDVTQARQMYVRDEVAVHANLLIAALWGDVWMDEMGLADRPDASDDDTLHHALKKIRKNNGWLFEHIVQPHLGVKMLDTLLEDFVQAELLPLAHLSSPDFRVKAFKTEQWSFRWSIPPTRVFQSAAWPRKVFYDTRLVDFFATVPASFVSGRQLQIDYLKRFAPDLARITWQVYDANLYQHQHFNTWLLPKRAAKKAWRMIRGKKVVQRNWEVQFLGSGGRLGLERWLTHPGLRLHEFISPTALKKLVEEFYWQSTPALAYPLSMLLTFSTWMERYG